MNSLAMPADVFTARSDVIAADGALAIARARLRRAHKSPNADKAVISKCRQAVMHAARVADVARMRLASAEIEARTRG